jgi:hypothetical protein
MAYRSKRRVQCRVGVECFPQLAVVPLFREQYRLVDNSILLLVCLGRSVEYAGHSVCIVRNVKRKLVSLCVRYWIRPMIRSRKAEPIGVFKTGCQRVPDVL